VTSERNESDVSLLSIVDKKCGKIRHTDRRHVGHNRIRNVAQKKSEESSPDVKFVLIDRSQI